MVKTRMGLVDLRVQTSILQKSLRGARVANVYDAHNGRTYILKLSVPPPRTHKPDSSAQNSDTCPDGIPTGAALSSTPWEKRLLLLESGVRLHMTHFDREKDVPSGFCLKLRKHIRTRRLHSIQQLGDGGDRIVDLAFSSEGSVSAHLIVEAYSGGNVILTDGDYTILTLLRTYKTDGASGDGRVAVHERYPVEKARQIEPLQLSTFQQAVKRTLSAVPDDATLASTSSRSARRKLQAKSIARKSLAVELSLEPCLLEHALTVSGFDTEATLKQISAEHDVSRIFAALADLDAGMRRMMESGIAKGYIVSSAQHVNGEEKMRYDEFAPYLFAQYRGRLYKEFSTFDEAADEFFSKNEADRADAAQAKREAAAFKKVDKLALELKGQVDVLENARDISWTRAQAIESNLVEVEAAITVIRSAIAASVTWDGLKQMVQDEKRNGNPVAEIIHSLQLEKNEMTLMLEDSYGFNDNGDGDMDDDPDGGSDDDDDDETEFGGTGKSSRFKASAQTRNALLVPVDLSLGAYANARRHYEQRRNAAAKMEKAVEVTDRTIKAASKRAATEAQKLEEEAVAASIRARRKPLWFEKFYWFVSSENYLVVAGKDAQQNELIVKRYLGPADVYVHADIQGASSVIVKNQKRPGQSSHAEIPRMTLEQAGTFAMCRSAAWDAKIVTSAWWVRASQVSKTAPSGLYLPTGSFVIRGKKNFLDPTQLVMGLGFLFKIDESCIPNHKGERGVRGLEASSEAPEKEINDPVGCKGSQTDSDLISTEGQLHSKEDVAILAGPKTDRISVDSNEDVGTVPSCSTEIEDSNITAADAVHEPDVPAVPGEFLTDSGISADDQEAAGEDENPETVVTAKKAPLGKKKHMSAKERRALRNKRNGKGDPAGGNEVNDGESRTGADTDAVELPKVADSKHIPNVKANAPLPRGKKHKLKKMKKYMDQDEEERNIALKVLGAKPMKESLPSAQAGIGTEKKEEASEHPGDDGSQANEDPKRERRAKREERHEVMRLMEEEGILELSKLEQESITTLDMLTAIPTAQDVVQYALPVCAPYGALQNYRYRAKLMPGTMKRGKAYRAAVTLFIKQAERDLLPYKQERDAMRISPENDGIHGMLGSVKVMAPGLAEAQKSLQKAKKSGGKKGKK